MAYASNAELLAVPVSRIDKRFFDLRSGLAGQIVQKFANYHIQLVVVGDVAEWTRNSRSFRDFVYEANNGNVLWFVTDEEALRAKLTGTLPGGLAAAFTSSRR